MGIPSLLLHLHPPPRPPRPTLTPPPASGWPGQRPAPQPPWTQWGHSSCWPRQSPRRLCWGDGGGRELGWRTDREIFFLKTLMQSCLHTPALSRGGRDGEGSCPGRPLPLGAASGVSLAELGPLLSGAPGIGSARSICRLVPQRGSRHLNTHFEKQGPERRGALLPHLLLGSVSPTSKTAPLHPGPIALTWCKKPQTSVPPDPPG